jgi:metal-responsive CopG/Arc/MetJ family transcriptional regulator
MKLGDFENQINKTKKINVDFPESILKLLDKESKKIGVTRQSIIKMWIAQRLKEEQQFQLNVG